MATRGFTGRQRPPGDIASRLPPGNRRPMTFRFFQPGRRRAIRIADWTFTIKVGVRTVMKWNWAEFNALPQTRLTRDIHCVTKWTKFNTVWEGVMIDDVLASCRSVTADAVRAGAFL